MVRYQVLTTTSMEMTVFLLRHVVWYKLTNFSEVLIDSFIISETSVNFYRTTRRKIPEDSRLQLLNILSFCLEVRCRVCCMGWVCLSVICWFHDVVIWLFWLVSTGSDVCSYHLLFSTFTTSLQIIKCSFVHTVSRRVIYSSSARDVTSRC
jgi:hypothetical protein